MAYARHQKSPGHGSESHHAIDTSIHQKGMKTHNPDPPRDHCKGPNVSEGATLDRVVTSHSINDGRTA
jgi:hypothetical protein